MNEHKASENSKDLNKKIIMILESEDISDQEALSVACTVVVFYCCKLNLPFSQISKMMEYLESSDFLKEEIQTLKNLINKQKG